MSKTTQNFTQKQIEQAMNISILDYIQANSIGELKRQSNHFYKLIYNGHDSIVIDANKNYFVHNAYQGQKNAQGNILNFIQYIHNNKIGFKEAMKEALTFIDKGYEPTNLTFEKADFIYDYQMSEDTQIIQDYLSGRGIDRELIQTLIAQGYLSQTTEGVLVANWTLDGRQPQSTESIIGASEQPTHRSRQTYKLIKKNSKSHYGFNIRYGNTIENIYVFEATVDLLSYLSLFPEKKENAHFISLEGVKHKTLYTILKENHPDYAQTCQIHISTDNDIAGIEFLDNLMEFNSQFQVINNIPYYYSFSKNQYRQIINWRQQQPEERQLPIPIALSFFMLERPYMMKKDEQKEYHSEHAKYFLDGIPEGLDKLANAFYSGEVKQTADRLIEHSSYSTRQQQRLLDLLKKARSKDLSMVTKIYKDWNDKILYPENLSNKEKALEKTQVITKKVLGINQEQNVNRSNFGKGSLQQEVEGSATPVSKNDTFERSVTSRPTLSYPLLKFITHNNEIQIKNNQYRLATEKDIQRLNQYAPSIQTTARWYDETLSNSKIHYIFKNGDSLEKLEVNFRKENFMHLTGIRPIHQGKNASDFIDDFIQGNGEYDNITVSHAIRDKLQVLPMLSDIIDSQSFVLNDLTTVEKLNKLDLSSAIKTKDKDLLLLFKDIGKSIIPASLMKLKGGIKIAVNTLEEKTILGVYQERDGIIKQLSINSDYIKDNGKYLLEILQNKQYETIQEQNISVSPNLNHSDNVQKIENADSFINSFTSLNEEDKRLLNRETHLSFDIIETFNKKGLIQKDENDQVIFVWKKHGEILGLNYLNGQEGDINSNQDSFIFTVGKPRHLLLFDAPVDALSFLDLNRDIQDTVFISSNPKNSNYFPEKISQYIQHIRIESIGDCLIKEKLIGNHLLKLSPEKQKIEMGQELISYQKYQPIDKTWTLDLKTVNNIKELNRNKQIQTAKEISKINEQTDQISL